jgi:hypothetical protein
MPRMGGYRVNGKPDGHFQTVLQKYDDFSVQQNDLCFFSPYVCMFRYLFSYFYFCEKFINNSWHEGVSKKYFLTVIWKQKWERYLSSVCTRGTILFWSESLSNIYCVGYCIYFLMVSVVRCDVDFKGTVSWKSWWDKAMVSKSRLQLRIATGFKIFLIGRLIPVIFQSFHFA